MACADEERRWEFSSGLMCWSRDTEAELKFSSMQLQPLLCRFRYELRVVSIVLAVLCNDVHYTAYWLFLIVTSDVNESVSHM